jgi:Trehalose-6-phosphate synthase
LVGREPRAKFHKDRWPKPPATPVINVVPVALSETERDEFYYGYSNEVIWPLFHDLQNFCNFEPAYWQAYKDVNDRYADAIARSAQPDDFIWVHDYHLMYVAAGIARAERLRKTFGIDVFLHIPFPPYDIFSKLPQQQRLLHALLQFDLLGFQTRRDVRNFLQCARRVLPTRKFFLAARRTWSDSKSEKFASGISRSASISTRSKTKQNPKR